MEVYDVEGQESRGPSGPEDVPEGTVSPDTFAERSTRVPRVTGSQSSTGKQGNPRVCKAVSRPGGCPPHPPHIPDPTRGGHASSTAAPAGAPKSLAPRIAAGSSPVPCDVQP